MKRLHQVVRVAVVLAVGLALLSATAGVAQAAPPPVTPGSAKVDAAVSGVADADAFARSVADPSPASLKPDAVAAACPVPGQRVKTSTSSEVFLVGPQYDLNLIPDRATYESLWDSWNGIVTNNSLWSCYNRDGAWIMWYAELAKESSSPKVYIYDYNGGGFRWITSATVFNKYAFSWNKINVYSAIGPKSSLNWS
jgi:hypothetical protein